jgi:hypothetical protein
MQEMNDERAPHCVGWSEVGPGQITFAEGLPLEWRTPSDDGLSLRKR